MTSPLDAFFTQVRTTLAAFEPHDDNTGLPYRPSKVRGNLSGATQHRTFHWMPSLNTLWVRGHGAGMPVLQHLPRLAIYVLQANRDEDQFTLDLIEENATLWRWFLAQHESGWGNGGIESVLMSQATFDTAKSRLIFTFTIKSQETA